METKPLRSYMNYDIEFIQRFRVLNDKIVQWKSYWDTVRGIVPFRGDMNARLVSAAKSGNIDEANLILPHGADPNTFDDATGLNVLMIAAGRGHLAFVQMLIAARADVRAVDKRAGATALHKASQGGHYDVARALIDAGAFVDAQCVTTGHTPLVEAVWFKRLDIVKLLLDCGAGLGINTHYGFTLSEHINYALKVNPTGRDMLIAADHAIKARQARDASAVEGQRLMKAVLASDLAGVKELLAGGTAVDERYPVLNGFNDGHTPLLVACRDGHTAIVSELLKAGANVNATEPTFGAVPLHKAVYNGHDDITEILVHQPGIDLNFQGATNGYTPLLDALWHGFDKCALILIRAGARLDLVGHEGRSALDLASEVLGADHDVTRTIHSRLDS
jgi:uncharacterized protein